MANSRVFYACQGVLVKERNTDDGDTPPVDGTYLNGVTSVGINGSFPSQSLPDIGRFQRKYHYYSPQEFEITIERVLDQSSDFFYHVDPSDYTSGKVGYENTHILADNNINNGGDKLKNYDVTVLYGADSVDLLSDNTSDIKYVTYRNCLITSINYNISAQGGAGVTESITLITRSADYDTDSASGFTLPSSAESGDIIKRADVKWDLLSGNFSILPSEAETIFDTSETLDGKKILGINNIQITAAINYSEITDIGKRRGIPETGGATKTDQGEQNLWRYVILPVQVTCSFTGTARQPFPSDVLNIDTTFSANNKIRLVAEKFPSPPSSTYFVWDLGRRNYLTDMSYSGGDTSGGNLEITMSYQNDRSDIVLVKDTTVRDLSAGRDFIY